MSQEIGKIEKPAADTFQKGRRIFYIPLIFKGRESPAEYVQKYTSYWGPAERQLADLESKLGKAKRIYHEMVAASGEEGLNTLKSLHEESHRLVKARVEAGAMLEAVEQRDLLTEFLDWSRCLAIGLENPKVFTTVYQAYAEAAKKRYEHIASRINETLKPDEIGVLFLREGHHVQFPTDIEVFYISPPELDDLKRWLRDREAKETTEHHGHGH